MAPDGGVIVTGAGRGIGAAIATALAARGRTVACLSRSGALPGDAAELVPYECDVTDAARVGEVVALFAEQAGVIAGLENKAGLHAHGRAQDVTAGEVLRLLEVNCVGALLVAQAARPHLAAAGGVIVGIGSFFDRLGASGSLAYSASKAALASVNRTLAVEWARDGISVVTVAPGYVLTDLNAEWLAEEGTRAKVERRIPVGRLGDPAEIGRFVATLMLEDVPFLTGETIYVDGGQGIRV
jgi:NAD(P)-dependent dehydrogenase (short-subunit alcohol dehydrogenase family)